MISEISGDVYRQMRLRKRLSLTRLAGLINKDRRTVQGWEAGRTLPDVEDEENLWTTTGFDSTRVAELLCRACSNVLDVPLQIRPEGTLAYQPSTLTTRVEEEIHANRHLLSDDQLEELESDMKQMAALKTQVDLMMLHFARKARAKLKAAEAAHQASDESQENGRAEDDREP